MHSLCLQSQGFAGFSPGPKVARKTLPIRPSGSAPEEIEAGVPLHQFTGLMDEVVGVGDEVPDGSVAEFGFDHAGLTGDTDRFGRVEERIAETALFIDEVERERLLAGPDLAGG